MLNLTAPENDANRFGSLLGFEFSNQFEVNTTPVEATFSFGWHHEFGDVSQTSAYSFSGSPTQFLVASPKEARDRFSLAAGLQFNPSKNSTLSFGGTFEKSNTSQQLGADVTLKLQF